MRGGQFSQVGQQVAAFLVEFSDYPWARAHRIVVKLPGELVLDNGALLLHHQYFFQALGKIVRTARFQRPGHAYLVDSQPDLRRHRLSDTHIFQRLHDIQVGLAAGDDAQARLGTVHYDPVEVIRPGKCPRCVDFVLVEAQFLVQWLVRPARVHAALR